jgi:uncharacterized protein (TIGR03118 family)
MDSSPAAARIRRFEERDQLFLAVSRDGDDDVLALATLCVRSRPVKSWAPDANGRPRPRLKERHVKSSKRAYRKLVSVAEIGVVIMILSVSVGAARPALADSPSYEVTNLVSDVPGVANHTDPNLVNAWGLAFNPFGPAWIADNGTGVATLYDGNGNPVPLVVSIPGGKPTGIVFNGSTNDFIVSRGGASGPAAFIFATETGTIAAWAPAVDRNHAITVVDNSSTGAIYKGLALAGDGTRLLLYATDFHNRKIDVFDRTFSLVQVAGGFADRSIPSTYGPFGIQNLLGSIYVTYAKQDRNREDDVAGRGLGIVNVFTASGTLIRQVAQGGPLNAPWGLAIAPADFGVFSNDLLIGNFGDGTINAFDLSTGRFLGQLSLPDRQPITIDGLWALSFGNGVNNQPTNALFFTAGPDDETHGLYGRITVQP